MKAGKQKAKVKGIRKGSNGRWQSYVRVRGRFYSRWWDPDTALTLMKRWIEEKRVRVRLGAALPAVSDYLSEDVRHYLEQIATMPTYEWRAKDLDLWVQVFGPDRDRKTITPGEIRAQLESWRKDYAASTVNHRRTALMHLFTVLDGKSAPNPARDVPKYREARRPPRALTPATIAALLNAMPASTTKARIELMAWTGWPHAQIMRLEPSDIDWNRAVYIRPRQKGSGIEGRWLPLLPQGWRALRAFKRAGAWGEFSTSSMRRSLRLAASHVAKDKRQPKAIRQAVADITPYDLRHSFLTLVALVTRNQRAVTMLGLHADPRQSQRYTEAAVDPIMASALSEVATQLLTWRKPPKSQHNRA